MSKGLLKKITGGLKMAVIMLPAAAVIAGAGTMVGGAIAHMHASDKLEQTYYTSQTVKNYAIDKIEEVKLNERQGNISENDATALIAEYHTMDKLGEIAKDIYADDLEFRGLVKQDNVAKAVTYSGLGVFVTGIASAFGMVLGDEPAGTKLYSSAKTDFKDARRMRFSYLFNKKDEIESEKE